MLEKIIKHLPLITIALIFLSFIELQTYYYVFGIDIYHYLDTPELIFHFIPIYSLLYISCLTLLAVIAVLGLDLVNYRRFLVSLKGQRSKILKIGTSLVVVSLFTILFINFSLGKIIFWIAQGCLAVNFIILYKLSGRDPFKMVFVLGLVFVGTIAMSGLEAAAVGCGSGSKILTIVQERDTIVSNGSLIFIGETKSHLFLYSKNSKRAMPFEKSKLTAYFFAKQHTRFINPIFSRAVPTTKLIAPNPTNNKGCFGKP